MFDFGRITKEDGEELSIDLLDLCDDILVVSISGKDDHCSCALHLEEVATSLVKPLRGDVLYHLFRSPNMKKPDLSDPEVEQLLRGRAKQRKQDEKLRQEVEEADARYNKLHQERTQKRKQSRKPQPPKEEVKSCNWDDIRDKFKDNYEQYKNRGAVNDTVTGSDRWKKPEDVERVQMRELFKHHENLPRHRSSVRMVHLVPVGNIGDIFVNGSLTKAYVIEASDYTTHSTIVDYSTEIGFKGITIEQRVLTVIDIRQITDLSYDNLITLEGESRTIPLTEWITLQQVQYMLMVVDEE